MKEKRLYIECNYCKIGGYDFCPMCFGGGGYSIPENEVLSYQKTTSKDDFTKISEKLNLIESSNVIYNDKIEKYLDTILIQLNSKSYTDESSKLLNQIIRIKAKKETKFWVEKFKEEFKKYKIDFFKVVITNETFHIERSTLNKVSENELILCFSANKEIFSNNHEILGSLPYLIDKSIFKIRYGENDMLNATSKKLIHNSNFKNILGFDIITHAGNAFFIIDIKSI